MPNPAIDKDVSSKPGLFARFLLTCVRGYQLGISPFLGANCRYQPTCSAYTKEAILTHGALKGGWIGLKRICRCHPLGGFGYDPVPSRGKRAPKDSQAD